MQQFSLLLLQPSATVYQSTVTSPAGTPAKAKPASPFNSTSTCFVQTAPPNTPPGTASSKNPGSTAQSQTMCSGATPPCHCLIMYTLLKCNKWFLIYKLFVLKIATIVGCWKHTKIIVLLKAWIMF